MAEMLKVFLLLSGKTHHAPSLCEFFSCVIMQCERKPNVKHLVLQTTLLAMFS